MGVKRFPVNYTLAVMLLFTIGISGGCGVVDAAYPADYAPDSLVQYSDEVQGFAVSYPHDWEAFTGIVDGISITRFTRADGSGAHYSVLSTALPSLFTLQDFYAEMTRVMMSARGYRLISHEPVTIDGTKAIQHNFTVDTPDDPMTGSQVVCIKDGTGWLVSLFCPSSSLSDAETLFSGMFDSFRLPLSKPVINVFAASQGTIYSGWTSTLTWDVTGSDEISISPSSISGPHHGSIDVSPSSTTTYTLTASNDAGTATASVTVSVNPGKIVGVDPVTGRNQDIDLIWEQLCLSTEYQVQIAKDPRFTLIVWDTGIYSPPDALSPALIIPPSSRFQTGQTYYIRWRVRGTATGEQIRSPWSAVEKLIIKQG